MIFFRYCDVCRRKCEMQSADVHELAGSPTSRDGKEALDEDDSKSQLKDAELVDGDEEGSLLGDHVDALPAEKRYSCMDLLCTVISMATYVFDLSMDVVVAVYFYHLAVSHGIYHYW